MKTTVKSVLMHEKRGDESGELDDEKRLLRETVKKRFKKRCSELRELKLKLHTAEVRA